MSDHTDKDNDGIAGWILSRTGIVTVFAVSILGFLIYAGHSAHLLGALPFLLILACPLLHIFMHRGHGSGRDQDRAPNDEDRRGERPHEHRH